MKTLKSIILGLALIIVCGVAKANVTNEGEYLTKNYAINTYVDAITRGKIQGFNDVIDQEAKFTMLRGKKVLSFTKGEIMESVKVNKNVEQQCTTSTTIVESNSDLAVVKVDMQFDGFVRSNYVTIANTGKGWKITNVYSVFK
ncbi:Putative lumazine-binding [Mucilaginibacter pineti]|uniref:Putative lumazine-binding n=1 Tax=Mucilaginibacter pineti TaxID=1391627 RepID=A0A1G7MQL8_9SPHI|nr:nuclear transport factor 2 family protein [Mucilaginibacter pineti]SDF63370.1 Putative lumazine-binding [Mucilaginibacter pineti]